MGETFIVLGETILVLGETICAKLVMGETRYNLYFDTIEQTRIARPRERQLVKTVLREGAKLIFFNALRCVIASPWQPTCICI